VHFNTQPSLNISILIVCDNIARRAKFNQSSAREFLIKSVEQMYRNEQFFHCREQHRTKIRVQSLSRLMLDVFFLTVLFLLL
jgi:hypothetical protein